MFSATGTGSFRRILTRNKMEQELFRHLLVCVAVVLKEDKV